MNVQSRRRLLSTEKKRSVIKLGEHKRSLSASKSQFSSSPLIQSTAGIVNAIDNRLQWTYTNLSNNQIKNLSSEASRFPNDLLTDYINYVYKNYNISDPKSVVYHSNVNSGSRMIPVYYHAPPVYHQTTSVYHHTPPFSYHQTPIKKMQFEDVSATKRSYTPHTSEVGRSPSYMLPVQNYQNTNYNNNSNNSGNNYPNNYNIVYNNNSSVKQVQKVDVPQYTNITNEYLEKQLPQRQSMEYGSIRQSVGYGQSLGYGSAMPKLDPVTTNAKPVKNNSYNY